MDLKEYSPLALRTVSSLDTYDLDLCHMALGVAGEAGEVADLIKKSVAYDKTLDTTKLLMEIGDVVFYLNALIHLVDATWSDVLAMNIAKLEARYPDGVFNADRANFRNIEAEALAVLKSVPKERMRP